jgi:hypothetical protein
VEHVENSSKARQELKSSLFTTCGKRSKFF